MSDPQIALHVMRKKARHKYLAGLTERERIEEGLEQDWYTVAEAAEILGEHKKTVYGRIKRDEIKAARPSERKTRIHYTDLAAYMSKVGGQNSK